MNILVLCANQSSITKHKATTIISEFSKSLLALKGFKTWNVYYSGINLSSLPSTTTTIQCQEQKIKIQHKILPDNVGNLKTHQLPVYVQNTLKSPSPRFFDIIINENCPAVQHLKWTILPVDLAIIFETLKSNGYYIENTTSFQHHANTSYQTVYDLFLNVVSLHVSKFSNWSLLQKKH